MQQIQSKPLNQTFFSLTYCGHSIIIFVANLHPIKSYEETVLETSLMEFFAVFLITFENLVVLRNGKSSIYIVFTVQNIK